MLPGMVCRLRHGTIEEAATRRCYANDMVTAW
jgi:hypothetical protein